LHNQLYKFITYACYKLFLRGTYDHGEINDDFEFDKKEEAFDVLFKIPPLEKVFFEKIYLLYFRPGQVIHLELRK